MQEICYKESLKWKPVVVEANKTEPEKKHDIQNSKKEKQNYLQQQKQIVLRKWELWFKHPLHFCNLKEKGVLAMQNSFQFLVTYKVENKNQQQQKQQQQQELT